MEHIIAIVLAAGKGSRMLSKIPKQFMTVDGKPLLYYSLYAFEKSCVNDIILVTNEEYVDYCKKDIIERYQISKVKQIVKGGTERYWSVWNGLTQCVDADFVLIHDAARPCLTQKMIEDSIVEVMQSDACTVGVPVKDTIKVVNERHEGIETPKRETLWQIQTPQSFKYKAIVTAYEKMQASGDSNFTDDTMIMERFLGKKTKIIMGDYRNIKVTTPEDLMVAELFLKKIKKVVDIDKG